MSFVARFFLVALLVGSAVRADEMCPPAAQTSPVAKFLHGNFGSGSFDLTSVVQKFFITDPQKQILPGDILVYPFKNTEPVEGEPPRPEEPDAYKAALEGYGHAGIVARNENGQLYHLDAPLPPPFLRGEFQGKDTYYVVRPKLPKGLSREAFEKRVNETVDVFKALGFEYDALMEMNYLNEGDLKKLSALVDKGCPPPKPGRPDFKNSPIPPQFCSELTQTVLVLAGGKAAKGILASKMFQLALDRVQQELKGKDPKSPEAKAAIEKTVNDVIVMFAGPLDRYEAELKKDMAEVEAELKQIPEGHEDRKQLEEVHKDMLRAKKRLADEKARWDLARKLLLQITLMRAQNPNLDPLGVMKRPIVRPIDILREAQQKDGNFELIGFYPGHMPATCKPPRFDGPPDGELPPPDGHNGIQLPDPPTE